MISQDNNYSLYHILDNYHFYHILNSLLDNFNLKFKIVSNKLTLYNKYKI